jgi:conjugative relaxase-like TrwC/TraI family protein
VLLPKPRAFPTVPPQKNRCAVSLQRESRADYTHPPELHIKVITVSYMYFRGIESVVHYPLRVKLRGITFPGMQTTYKISGSSATTYAAYLTSASSRGDYYTPSGEGEREGDGGGAVIPGRWHGSPGTLAGLGLSADRPVARGELRALMQGLSPVDGSAVRPVGSDGSRVAGIDMTFSPPKTVSALWATSSDYRRAQIEVAHTRAVRSALARTEREVEVVRRKSGGVVRFEKAQGLLAAEFTHTSSRLAQDQEAGGVPDPQLHSHVVVLAAERTDGQLAAVESRQLYRAARENGAWYRSELAANLQDLGLEVERRTGKGERYFEVRGVSIELAERWSTRAQDVDRASRAFRQRYGREPQAGELGSLTLETRGSKTAAATVDVNEAWRAVGEEYGQTTERTEELFNDRSLATATEVELRRELLAAVTEQRSMITERELKARAYELSAGVSRPAEADRLMSDLHRSGELLQLEGGLWTTRSLREREQNTVQIAKARAGEHAAPVSEQTLRQARRETAREIGGPLTSEQLQALEQITGPGGVSVLVGQAGSGKGVVISAASEAWRKEGYEVIGTAIPGATAKRLGADAKLEHSLTTDALINRVENGNIRLDAKTVVVMDEAGMADSKRLPRLVELTADRGSKLLLAGDSAQLPSIGAGGLFKELQANAPTAQLSEVHRARNEWEKQAWTEIRNGEAARALARYEAYERLHIHDTREQAAQAMVENWDATRRNLPAGQAVIITDASNTERDQINAIAQEHRARAGELGSHQVELPGKPYGLAAGDEIIFTAQHHPPGQQRVENGITGTITDTSRNEDEHHVTIKTRENPPRDVQVNTSEFHELSLGYAVHVYKAQGLTAERASVLTGGWQTDRENAYVALSRARDQTHIYLSREDLGQDGLDPGAIEHLAQLMQQSHAQEASITREVDQPTADRSSEITQQTAERSMEASWRVSAHDHQPEIEPVLEARQDQQQDREQHIDLGFATE